MTVIYPGTFDPVTLGHIDIIRRTSRIFNKVIVAMPEKSTKNTMFPVEERKTHLSILTEALKNVEIKTFSGLLADFAKQNQVNTIIRGIRNITDFEYEFQMAALNQTQNYELETFFISASSEYLHLSSSAVSELARLGGCIDQMVPPLIKDEIAKVLRSSINSRQIYKETCR